MKRKRIQKKVIALGIGVAIAFGGNVCLTHQALERQVYASVVDVDHIRSEWGPSFSNDGLLFTRGQYAYCMQFGVASPSGQDYKEVVTGFERNDKITALLAHGFPSNISNLKEKYRISDREAANATQWAMHAIADQIGFPGTKPFTVQKFMNDAPNNAMGAYGKELLQIVLKEKAEVLMTISPQQATSVYDSKLNLLVSDQFFSVQVNHQQPITFSQLPHDVFVIDENGERIESVVANQKFKFATTNLHLRTALEHIQLESRVREHAAVFFSFPGVQTIVQTTMSEPLKTLDIMQQFTPTTGNIEFVKMNKTTQKPLPNMQFSLFNQKGETVATALSDTNGKVRFNNILFGEYTIQEISLKGDGIIDLHDIYKVTVEAGQTVTLNGVKEVENEETTTIIRKSDIVNGKCVSDAKLQIIDEQGTVITEWGNDCSQSEKIVYRLKEGKYILKEINAPNRYQYTKDIPFIVKEDGTITRVEMKDDRTRLTINKRDGITKENLAKAKLGLYTQQGELVKMLDREGNEVDAVVWSDENGKAVFEGVEFGNYVIKEIEAPRGYMLNSDMYVTISQNGNTVREFIDYKIPEQPKTPIPDPPKKEMPPIPKLPRTSHQPANQIDSIDFGIIAMLLIFLIMTMQVKRRYKNE